MFNCIIQRQVKLGQEGQEAEREKKIVEGNHPNIADAKKKRKVTTMSNGQTDGRDSRREILKKRGRLKKKTTSSPITINS